jgi:hypothetical protein
VLPVLVERGRPDDAQLATREHRLEHVAGVHRALGLSRPDDRVHLVDEHDEQAFRVGDLLEHRLEPLLELASELGAGDEGAHVERDQPLVLEPLGDVAVHDALREALGDRRLADARLADEDGVVLRTPRQHLHHATDLLVAADDGIELPLARHLGEIARVALQRLILVLGRLVGDTVRASHRLQRLEQRVVRRAERGEDRATLGALGVGESEQQVLGGDVLVTEVLRLLLRSIEHLIELARERGLGIALLRVAGNLAPELIAKRSRAHAELLQQRNDDAFILRQQRREEVQIVDERIAIPPGLCERLVQRFGGLHGKTVGIDHRSRSGNGRRRWGRRDAPAPSRARR